MHKFQAMMTVAIIGVGVTNFLCPVLESVSITPFRGGAALFVFIELWLIRAPLIARTDSSQPPIPIDRDQSETT